MRFCCSSSFFLICLSNLSIIIIIISLDWSKIIDRVLEQEQIQRDSKIELHHTPPNPAPTAPGAQGHPSDQYSCTLLNLYSHFHQALVCEPWVSWAA